MTSFDKFDSSMNTYRKIANNENSNLKPPSPESPLVKYP